MRLLATALLVGTPLLLTACDSGDTDGPPRRAIITAVQVEDGPLFDLDTGDTWDGTGGGGPEVYFRLAYADEPYDSPNDPTLLDPKEDAFVVPRTSDQPWYENVDGGSFPLVWDIGEGFEANLRDEYRIVLYDHDPVTSAPDDFMISAEPFFFDDFAPNQVDGREETIVLNGIGQDEDEVQVRLRVVFED